MKTVTDLGRISILAVVLFLILLGVITEANAMLVVEEVEFVDEAEGESERFYIKQPGLYELTLIDFKFPEAFESLSVQLTRGGNIEHDNSLGLTEVNRLTGPGSFTFEVGFSGNYFANIFAIPGKEFGTGLFGLQINQLSTEISAVPLPPAFLLLLSGLGMLVSLTRKHRV